MTGSMVLGNPRARLRAHPRRTILVGLCLLLLVGSGALFAGGGGEGSAAVTYPVKIGYWYSIGGSAKDTSEILIKTYNDAQKKYIIEGVFNGGYPESLKKMLAAAVAKNLPALGHQANTYAPTLAQAGAFQPLDDIIKADKSFKKEDIVPSLMAGNFFQGKQWGIPFNNSTSLLYLNKDLFKQAGVDPDKFPATWGELPAMLRALKAKLPADVVPYNVNPGSYWIPHAYLYTFGGALLNPDNKSVPWDSPEMLACVTYFQNLKREGLVSWQPSPDGFYAGKHSITTDSSASLTNHIKRCNFNLGVAKIPKGVKQSAIIGGGSLYMFANKSRGEQEAAWDFMKFMTTKDSQVTWSNGTGYLACNLAAIVELGNTTHKTDPRFAAAFQQMPYALTENTTFMPTYEPVRDVFVELWQRIMISDEDPKKVLPEQTAKANKLIKES